MSENKKRKVRFANDLPKINIKIASSRSSSDSRNEAESPNFSSHRLSFHDNLPKSASIPITKSSIKKNTPTKRVSDVFNTRRIESDQDNTPKSPNIRQSPSRKH